MTTYKPYNLDKPSLSKTGRPGYYNTTKGEDTMLKRQLEWLRKRREKLRQEYNQDTGNSEVKQELLLVNRIITREERRESARQ